MRGNNDTATWIHLNYIILHQGYIHIYHTIPTQTVIIKEHYRFDGTIELFRASNKIKVSWGVRV